MGFSQSAKLRKMQNSGITVKTQLCRKWFSVVLFSTVGLQPLLIVLADLSTMASVLLRGLPLLPPGRVRSNSVGYLPESHPGVVGGRWEIKAKKEWECKNQSSGETRRQVSGNGRQIRESRQEGD